MRNNEQNWSPQFPAKLQLQDMAISTSMAHVTMECIGFLCDCKGFQFTANKIIL